MVTCSGCFLSPGSIWFIRWFPFSWLHLGGSMNYKQLANPFVGSLPHRQCGRCILCVSGSNSTVPASVDRGSQLMFRKLPGKFQEAGNRGSNLDTSRVQAPHSATLVRYFQSRLSLSLVAVTCSPNGLVALLLAVTIVLGINIRTSMDYRTVIYLYPSGPWATPMSRIAFHTIRPKSDSNCQVNSTNLGSGDP
jgi:hypothetical protein